MSDECKAILDFLSCEYELLESERGGDNILARFNTLSVQGQTDGFYPLIIVPSDTLAEILEYVMQDNDVEKTPEGMAAYRQTVIDAAGKIDAAACLSARMDENREYCTDERVLGQFAAAEPQNNLTLHMLAYGTSEEVIIAKIPTTHPWELAAWMPMGGFNDCPMPAEQVAVFQHWYEQYGAIPAVVTCDIWEMILTKPPVTDEKAEMLAAEHYAFCSDIVDQGAETIRALASVLKNSAMWFFWWD